MNGLSNSREILTTSSATSAEPLFECANIKAISIFRRLKRGSQDRASIEDAENLSALEARLVELDEDIEKVREEIEVLRSNEQIAPLQLGCAFFGLFGFILLILAFFTTVGKNYFGGWLFYLSLATVILLSARRMKRKLPNPEQLEYFRKERATLEEALAQLAAQRTRLQNLKEEAFGEPANDE